MCYFVYIRLYIYYYMAIDIRNIVVVLQKIFTDPSTENHPILQKKKK